MEAIAGALDISLDDLLRANSSFRPSGGGCTSFALASDMTATGAPILHKNRDFRVEPQIVYFKRVEGFKRFLGSASVWDVGTAHFLNESGLAGACNTGSKVKDATGGGLTDRHLLRLVAESASSCEDAISIVEWATREGLVGTEGGAGFILLFADPREVAVVELSGRKVAWRRLKEGFVVRSNHFVLPEMAEVVASEPGEDSRRRLAATQAEIAPGGPPWEARRAFSVARRPEICKASTVSAFTHVLSARFPEVLSLAWVALGPPLLSSFVPVPICSSGVPREWASGEAWTSPKPLERPKRSPKKASALEEAEESLSKEVERALSEAEERLRAGRRDLALDSLSGRLAEWAKGRKTTK
ncbi:MAG TPA: hypothetical protein EYP65_02635 [Armatimonadetes bacterium]|nr:hypothetical protein [Armatimonadota bacterium]